MKGCDLLVRLDERGESFREPRSKNRGNAPRHLLDRPAAVHADDRPALRVRALPRRVEAALERRRDPAVEGVARLLHSVALAAPRDPPLADRRRLGDEEGQIRDEAAELPPSVRDWEPAVSLFSADGGLSATAAIVRGAPPLLAPGGVLALEVDCRRASLVAESCMANGTYRDVQVLLDLTGRERFVVARRV